MHRGKSHFGERGWVGNQPQRADNSEDSRFFNVLRLVEGRPRRAPGQNENDWAHPGHDIRADHDSGPELQLA